MKKNNLKVVKIDKNKSLVNYEKKILINDLILDLKLGYFDYEKEKRQDILAGCRSHRFGRHKIQDSGRARRFVADSDPNP